MSAKPNFPIYPLWWKVPPVFFRKLTRIATRDGRTEAEVLMDALSCMEKNRSTKTVHMNWKGPKDLAKLRWSKTTPEERSALGRRMARIRWEAKNNQ